MKYKTVGFFTAVSVCSLLGIFLLVSTSSSQIATGQQSGSLSDGLQMSISLVGSAKVDSPAFRVALQNVGEKDVTLNLGEMLANGKVQLPDNIRLNLKDATGKTRELHFSDKRYPGVAGRVDDYVVPLRSGSSYTLLLKLEQFWSPETKEFTLKLNPGRYQVSAQFEGSGAKTHNIGSEGIALMNFWKGKLQSNVLTFER